MTTYYQVCKLPESIYPYRGVQRLGPYPPDNEADDPKLFAECMRYFESDQKLKELEEARILWDALGDLRPDFEIIRIDSSTDSTASGTARLFGFDVVEEGGWNSFLSWDWYASAPSEAERAPNLVLMSLIFEHFYDTLNERRLFPNQELAQRFADATNALNKLAPGTFESPEAGDSRVIAVHGETTS